MSCARRLWMARFAAERFAERSKPWRSLAWHAHELRFSVPVLEARDLPGVCAPAGEGGHAATHDGIVRRSESRWLRCSAGGAGGGSVKDNETLERGRAVVGCGAEGSTPTEDLRPEAGAAAGAAMLNSPQSV